MTPATASQTIGPFWHVLDDPAWSDLTRFGAEGERIALFGAITDGDGAPVGDACVEARQASPAPGPAWDGFGRVATGAGGGYRLTTLRPGAAQGEAPHVAITVFARGLLRGLNTRAYFEGDPLNERDPLLASLDPARRATLVARNVGERDGVSAWRFDIRLQGEGETVFLDI